MDGLNVSDVNLQVQLHPSRSNNVRKAVLRELSSLLLRYVLSNPLFIYLFLYFWGLVSLILFIRLVSMLPTWWLLIKVLAFCAGWGSWVKFPEDKKMSIWRTCLQNSYKLFGISKRSINFCPFFCNFNFLNVPTVYAFVWSPPCNRKVILRANFSELRNWSFYFSDLFFNCNPPNSSVGCSISVPFVALVGIIFCFTCFMYYDNHS